MGNQEQESTKWPKVHRLGFRFAFVYFLLYLPFPLGSLPFIHLLAQQYERVFHKFVPWVGRHILHLSREIVVSNRCSGDTLYDYVRVLCIVSIALLASIVWMALDRSQSDYQRLHQWVRLYLRLSVGSAMLVFGAGKIFTVQFPPPNLYKLMQPYGDFSPMSLLWTFMGSSHPYSVLTGWIQVLGGVLLFIPWLTTLGALVCIAVSANIFALNLFCDVPVKLYSLHLLLFSFFLVLPDAQRLINFFLLNRAVAASSEPGLFKQRRLNTAALFAQMTLGGFLLCSFLYQAHKYEIQHFGGATRPPFYGIWTVDEFTLAGKSLAPSTDDPRWQKVVFQFPEGVGVQSPNGAWTRYQVHRDMTNMTLTMEGTKEPQKRLEFAFSNPDSQLLDLVGSDGRNEIRIKLHRLDEKQFTLLRSGFHWINEDADLVGDEEGVCDHVRRTESPLQAR